MAADRSLMSTSVVRWTSPVWISTPGSSTSGEVVLPVAPRAAAGTPLRASSSSPPSCSTSSSSSSSFSSSSSAVRHALPCRTIFHRQRLDTAVQRAPRGPRGSPCLPRARSEIPDFLPASWTKPKIRDQVGPNLELSGEEAVLLQLQTLQDNDRPYPDHGVEVMYRFASFDPFQRSRYFGPRLDLGQFERFRRLFHHSTYRVLLGHREHQVLSSVYLGPGRLRQRVRVLGLRPGEDDVFEFTVVQREGGSWDGYWFTESLIHDGEGVSRGIAY